MMIMSRPAPMPLVNFPRTSTLNGCGVVPRVTVYPVTDHAGGDGVERYRGPDRRSRRPV